MKKNYFLSCLCFVFSLVVNSTFGQIVTIDDYASIPNGSATTVVIQDVLANDTFAGLPATLSNVAFVAVSSTNNFLTLSPTGSLIFSNGPAPIGTYTLQYYIDAIGSNCCEVEGRTFVNIGCNPLNPPVVTNVIRPTCSISTGSVSLDGLPAIGQWTLYDGESYVQQGTGTTVTLNNLYPGKHEYYVVNNQGCRSPSSLIVDLRYLNAYLTGNYVDSNNDGIPSPGDAILYNCTVSNESNCAITNVNTLGGNITLGGPIASLPAGMTDSSTLTNSYTITQNDINLGYVSKFTTIRGTAGNFSNLTNVAVSATNYLNQSNGMKLVAFIDVNGNGIQDPNEDNFRFGNFTYQINNDGVTHNIAANQACYLYETNAANSYDFGFNVYPSYAAYYGLATPTINNITVAIGSGITTYYFPLTIIPYVDLAVTLYSSGAPPRPGFTYANIIQIRNNGNELIPAGTVTFTKNNVVSVTAVSPTGTLANATGFTYDFTNLSAGESRYIYVTMQTPTIPTVALGDLLTNTTSVTIPTGDVDINNNNFSLTQSIVGSYDPNDKAESHGGRILHAGFSADDYLTYTIRFENTGNFNAEFVRVNDVLDAKLDETSIRMVDASHSYVLDRVGSNLSWFFDDIQLPPSVANTNIGHGYIVFQVKPKPGFALGDIIPNTADIFFDFNPAIVTNTCTTEFVPFLGVDAFDSDAFEYYPNPTSDIVTFAMKNTTTIDTIEVIDVLGKTLISKAVHFSNAEIDFSSLKQGIYLVKLKADGQKKTVKITKN